MNRPISWFTLVLICVAASIVSIAAPGSAATPSGGSTPASCDFTAHVDVKRIVVNAYQVRYPTHVTVAEPGCDGPTWQWEVEVYLTHHWNVGGLGGGSTPLSYSGVYTNQPKNDPHKELFYAMDLNGPKSPGVFHWALNPKGHFAPYCNANDQNGIGNDVACTVTGVASVQVKFGSRAFLTSTRSRPKISFHTKATRYYYSWDGKYGDPSRWGWRPENTPISIQRLVNGTWTTIHTATPKVAKTGYTWTTTDKHTASYRAITPENSQVFGGASATAKK